MVAVTKRLLFISEAARCYDSFELRQSRIKFFINYNVLEFWSMCNLGACAHQTTCNRLGRIGAAMVQPPFKRLIEGGRMKMPTVPSNFSRT